MIFVDTGAFLARHLARDQYHRRAVEAWSEIRRRGLPCVTTNFVLDEAITLLGRRTSPAFAVSRARRIYSSNVLKIVRPMSEDEEKALDWLEKYADQNVSFTDCVSFVMMKRHRLTRAFTFDRHFEVAGFQQWPGR